MVFALAVPGKINLPKGLKKLTAIANSERSVLRGKLGHDLVYAIAYTKTKLMAILINKIPLVKVGLIYKICFYPRKYLPGNWLHAWENKPFSQ